MKRFSTPLIIKSTKKFKSMIKNHPCYDGYFKKYKQ